MSEENALIPVSMEIIMNAGDARTYAFAAIGDARNGDFESAESKLAQAEEAIVNAHRAQTDILQEEMNGQSHELCILFIHAQDTLMTIRTEVNMAKEMVTMYREIVALRKERA